MRYTFKCDGFLFNHCDSLLGIVWSVPIYKYLELDKGKHKGMQYNHPTIFMSSSLIVAQ